MLCFLFAAMVGSYAQQKTEKQLNKDSIQYDKFGKLLYTVVSQYVDSVDSEDYLVCFCINFLYCLIFFFISFSLFFSCFFLNSSTL